MNSLLYYYNNVQKMAAYRQAKNMQRGVKLGENQSPTAATKLVSKGLPIGVDDFSIEFYGNSYGSAGYGYPTIFSNTKPVDWQTYAKSFGENGIQTVFYNSTVNKPEVKYTAPNESTRFHFVWTRENTTLRAYINGDLTGEVVDIPVKDLGDLQLAIANSSDVSFVRVWNYALSADEIATLYNNGDPMGYVVPKTMKDRSEFSLTGTTSYTWIGNDDPTYLKYIPLSNSLKRGSVYRISVTISDYESGDPFVHVNRVYSIPASNGTYTIYVRPASENNVLYISGGYQNTDRRLTLTVNSIIPVGILAEYLPQNLMYGRDDKTIVTSWLDSAKQMPLSDEYMEPLFQSIGGYDMAANGAPEILYNE